MPSPTPEAINNQATADTPSAPGNDLAQSQYNFDYTVFPTDLGMDDNGHYMIININVPTKGIKTSGLTLGTPAGAFTQYFTPLNQVSKLDTLRYGVNVTGGAQGGPLSIPRNTRRIAESIALHMPTPLVFTGQNIYEEISLTSLAGKLGVGAVKGIVTDIFGKNAGRVAGEIFGAAGQVAGTAAQLAQNPINPAIEVLFANTAQRQFVFEVLMAPRNEKESLSIKKIAQTLRFHSHPEINQGAGGLGYGFTWIPPADFDITFFNKGVENTNILRINTCVLERCEVDYAPQGVYSTFRNGHPVAVRLSMAFRELEPLHKQRILQGF
jgi:hypothetical protein